ncbi:hypothetical protein BDV36DRAFT_295051 [Aspergillus pseudocaelatus]|uniref:Transcription factor domain-containing protein n=1 Tax=Aspergillus pseudocaelatus TaxID=1825620 RepID=A0ABQ6WNC9_9EURO|nr:hypothetical protein BDV36DRAFT_295051 [Aspergillus pseudocaelatus]
MFSRLVHLDATPSEDRAILLRLAWGCYILECDDLAEFHLPRSGIEVFIDRLPFPSFTEPNHKISYVFLARCSVRRLLNRVHAAIYSTNQHRVFNASFPAPTPHQASEFLCISVAPSEIVLIELTRQLEVWFGSIPELVRPDLHSSFFHDPLDTVICALYYAAKHIICRPCVIYAASTEYQHLPDYVVANCKHCIEACRQFVHMTSSFLKKRTPGAWLGIQALFAAILTLSVSKCTPSIEEFVPDFYDLIQQAIQVVEVWADYCKTARIILDILKKICQSLLMSVPYGGQRTSGPPA